MRVDELLEIGIKVFEYKIEVSLGGRSIGFGRRINVLDTEEANDVERLGEHLEEGNLSEGSGRDAFLVHFQSSLLQSYQLSTRFLLRLVHLAVRSFSYLLKLLVFVHGCSVDRTRFQNQFYTVQRLRTFRPSASLFYFEF